MRRPVTFLATLAWAAALASTAAAQRARALDIDITNVPARARPQNLFVLSRRVPQAAVLAPRALPPAAARAWTEALRARAALGAGVRAMRAQDHPTSAARWHVKELGAGVERAEEAALAALRPVEPQLASEGWLIDAELRWAHAARLHLAALDAFEARAQRGQDPGTDPPMDVRPVLDAARAAQAGCARTTATWIWARYLEGYALGESGDDDDDDDAWRDIAASAADAALAQEGASRTAEIAYEHGDFAAAAAAATQAAAGPDANDAARAQYRLAWARMSLGQRSDALSDALAVATDSQPVSDDLRADALLLAAIALDALGDPHGAAMPASTPPTTAARVLVALAARHVDSGALAWASTALDSALARSPSDAELAA